MGSYGTIQISLLLLLLLLLLLALSIGKCIHKQRQRPLLDVGYLSQIGVCRRLGHDATNTSQHGRYCARLRNDVTRGNMQLYR